MNEVTGIIQAIVQFGFPAVWSVLILWYCTRQIESHKEETSQFTQAINRNTETINELKTMITMLISQNGYKGDK